MNTFISPKIIDKKTDRETIIIMTDKTMHNIKKMVTGHILDFDYI